MTDTQTPERIWVKLKGIPKFYESPCEDMPLLKCYVRADFHAAVVAERDQLKHLLKEAVEWNWIDFQGEEQTYPRLSNLASEIQTALEDTWTP